MKKYLFSITLAITILSILLIPNRVFAKTEMTNLQEATDEEIETFKNESSYKELVKNLKEYDLSEYKDDENKINVYLFRGNTCSHCFEAVAYFASIYNKEGKYFNVKTYEVWGNEDNNNLMEKVGKKLGDEVSGVPYIVIGDKSWSGYSSSYNDEIMETIKSEYEKNKKERTDVVKNINKSVEKNDKNHASDILAILIIILVVGGITIGIIMTRKKATT